MPISPTRREGFGSTAPEICADANIQGDARISKNSLSQHRLAAREILIRGKGRLHDPMPLPADAGEAVVDDIKNGRKGATWSGVADLDAAIHSRQRFVPLGFWKVATNRRQ